MSDITEISREKLTLSLQNSGVSLPFRLLSLAQAKTVTESVIPKLELTPVAGATTALTTRHLDNQQIYSVATDRKILDRLLPVLGERIVLWQSHFFIKDGHQARVPWHQDAYHWPLQPRVAISAWLALTTVTEESGCLKLIPGMKNQLLPTRRVVSPCHRLFREEAVLTASHFKQAINMTLDPGEAFLFDSYIPHASLINTSGKKRIALAMRYTRSDVKVDVKHPLVYLERQDGQWVETGRSEAEN